MKRTHLSFFGLSTPAHGISTKFCKFLIRKKYLKEVLQMFSFVSFAVPQRLEKGARLQMRPHGEREGREWTADDVDVTVTT